MVYSHRAAGGKQRYFPLFASPPSSSLPLHSFLVLLYLNLFASASASCVLCDLITNQPFTYHRVRISRIIHRSKSRVPPMTHATCFMKIILVPIGPRYDRIHKVISTTLNHDPWRSRRFLTLIAIVIHKSWNFL